MSLPYRLGAVASALALLAGCFQSPLSAPEATDTVQRALRAHAADTYWTTTLDLTTEQTIGERHDAAAQTVADWFASQAPCATSTLTGNADAATLTLDFGTVAGACVWQGASTTGQWTLDFTDALDNGHSIDHTWTSLHHGELDLDGTATVTVPSSGDARTVTTDHVWTDPDGTVDVQGTHTLQWLDLAAGELHLDGSRQWTDEEGTWSLEVVDCAFFLDEAIPYTGTWTITRPDDRTVDLVFGRDGEGETTVTLDGTWRSWVFVVMPEGTRLADGA